MLGDCPEVPDTCQVGWVWEWPRMMLYATWSYHHHRFEGVWDRGEAEVWQA